ncbi:MAG: ricin-type beta-trefoil lectin domain protein [Endozoicomonas sp.]|uniref:ricin-type beta-trefoil lectin domain protein n=1 Tax=Endozoicomonas sp. TaxID=1892382 RepID=UPI003D9BF563
MAGRWNYKNGWVVIPVSLWVFFPLGAFLYSFSLIAEAELSDNNLVVERFANRFFLQQEDGLDCLELDVEGVEFEIYVHQDSEPEGRHYPRNRAVIKPCDENSSSQKWHYNFQKKTIHFQGYSTSMCLSRMIETLEMLPCIGSTNAQIWMFDEQGRLSSATDGRQGKGYITLVDKSDDPAPLAYRYLESDMGERRCYKNLHTGQIICEYEAAGPDTDRKPEQGESSEDSEEGRSESDWEEPEKDAQKPEKPVSPEEVIPPEEEEQAVLEWEQRPESAFWVSERLTEDILLVNQNPRVCLNARAADNCLSESSNKNSCYSASSIELTACNSQNSQVWRHDLKTKRIFNRAAGYQYCLTWVPGGFSLLPCFPGGSPAQKWYFAKGKTEASLERGQLRTMLNGILDPYSYSQALTLPKDVIKPKKKKSQALKIHFEWLYVECGRHPVTGRWQGDCPISP